VDNNRSTNRLAAWTLERASRAVEELRGREPRPWRKLNARLRVGEREAARWRRIAERMWYPRTSKTGVLEQHEGYFDLKPVRLKLDENDMPIVSRALWHRLGGTQLLKQADVVLLQFLFPDEHDLASKRANYAYYSPRTTHRSSLSPSTYAIMGAEVGDMREAWRSFRRTAFMDLDDHQGSVASGIHAAALGGTWMAVVNGFAGMRLGEDGRLRLAPRLPEHWKRLKFRIHYRGALLGLTCGARRVVVEHVGGRGRVRLRIWDKDVVLARGSRRRVTSSG